MKYYVYIFLDPRKPGKYVYGEFEFKYEPFYIGKGKNKRISVSLNETCFFKSNKVKSIRNDGFEPINFKLYTELFECEAIIKEIELIKLIGRFDKKIGPLCNLTDGGDGVSGRINSSETKKTMSKSRKLFLEKNPEAKISLINIISPYWIKNKNVLKNWVLKNPGHLDKIRNTNGSIEKISKYKKDWWNSHPEEKKILSKKMLNDIKKIQHLIKEKEMVDMVMENMCINIHWMELSLKNIFQEYKLKKN